MRNPVQYICFFIAAGCTSLSAQSVGGATSGAAAYCDSLNSGFISLNGHNGSILYWEQSTDDQNTWQQLQNTTSTQSYNKLKITTSYRAIVQDGSFPPDTSTVATITVHVPAQAGTVAGGGTFCYGTNHGTLTLTGTSGAVKFWQAREENGVWINVNNSTFTLSFLNLLKSTEYRAVVQRVPGCDADSSSSEHVRIDETSVSGVLTGGDTLCFGTEGDTITISGQKGVVLEWLVSEDGKTWVGEPTGELTYVYPQVTVTLMYAATVKNGVCDADTTDPIVVAAYPRVIAEAGHDVTIRRLESVQLLAEANGSVSWSPGKGLSDSSVVSPVAAPAETTVYKLVVTDPYGCTESDSVKVVVEIPIPSAITPNGDGINDNFEIYEVDKFENNSLFIYNRWGQLVYKAAPYKNEWVGLGADGSAVAEDTYFYTFDYGRGEKPVTGYILVKR